jgi:hypothetical protein
MQVAGPTGLYLSAVVLCGALVLPLLRAAFGARARGPLLSLALTVGYPLALAVLSPLARRLPDYAIALPVALLLLAAAAAALRRRQRRQPGGTIEASGWDRGADALLPAGFVAVLVPAVVVRSLWPAPTWDNSLAWGGVEKMFNLSMIQAFTFERGFPPENPWLAGQPIDSPVLAHALSALVAWTMRAAGGNAASAGALFAFSDAFLFALAGLAVAAWTHALLSGNVARKLALVIAAAAGLGVLLATSGKAVALVFEALFGGAQVSWLQL